MRPTKQLIRGLRETAQQLRESEDGYNWHVTSACNCGRLARTILDCSERELPKFGCTWTKAAGEYLFCQATGMPVHFVSEALLEAGVERGDYSRIEYLEGNEDNAKDRFAVAAWMDAEADKLEARRAAGELPERTCV